MRASRPTRRRSTATGTPPSGSRLACTRACLSAGRCYDVAIIGAGYVGVPLAATFAEAGCRVLLVDVRRATSSRRSTAARATSRTSRASASRRSSSGGLVHATTTTSELRRRGRDPDRAADAALAPARARPLDRRVRGARRRHRAARGPGRRARVDDVAGHDPRGAAADPRGGLGPEGRRGLPSRDVARARRPGPRGLDDEDDAEGRRRDHAGVHEAARPTSTAARSTPSHEVSTPEAAELTKLLENIFRSVNIALVNELAQLCDRMDIDVWEVVDAAATKPFGFMRFSPAPASAATASRSTPSTSRGRRASSASTREFIELAGEGQQEHAVLLPLARSRRR